MVVIAYGVLAFLVFGGRFPSVILGAPFAIVSGIFSIPFPSNKRKAVQGAFCGMGATLALFWLVFWAFHTIGKAGTWKPLLFASACLVIPFLMRNAYIKIVREQLETKSWSGSECYEKVNALRTLRGWRVGEVVGVIICFVFAFQR